MNENGIGKFQSAFGMLPPWAVDFIFFALALILALVAYAVMFRVLTRAAERFDLFWRSLVSRTRGPLLLAAIIVALTAASTLAPLTDVQTGIVRHILSIAVIVLIAWVVSAALHIWVTVYLRRFKLDSDDNLLARKHVTQTRIMRRVADTIIIVVAIGAALMTFQAVRQYGVSLLASAGAAGIIIGLALQTVLKNLFAGIQLAIAQPIRIDDVVIVEGEWGKVEEITSTYVVIRIWDLRRLIVPLSYFIEQPFQNWTRENANIIGSVMIYLDYTVPVKEVREKAREIVKESPLWNGNVFALQVTDFKETTMEVRIIVGARNAGDAFDLRCLIREELVGWLQQEYPEALPQTRVVMRAGQRQSGDVPTI